MANELRMALEIQNVAMTGNSYLILRCESNVWPISKPLLERTFQTTWDNNLSVLGHLSKEETKQWVKNHVECSWRRTPKGFRLQEQKKI